MTIFFQLELTRLENCDAFDLLPLTLKTIPLALGYQVPIISSHFRSKRQRHISFLLADLTCYLRARQEDFPSFFIGITPCVSFLLLFLNDAKIDVLMLFLDSLLTLMVQSTFVYKVLYEGDKKSPTALVS